MEASTFGGCGQLLACERSFYVCLFRQSGSAFGHDRQTRCSLAFLWSENVAPGTAEELLPLSYPRWSSQANCLSHRWRWSYGPTVFLFFTSSIAVAHGRDTRTRSLSGNRLLSVDTKAEVTLLKYISNFRVAGRSADSLTAACWANLSGTISFAPKLDRYSSPLRKWNQLRCCCGRPNFNCCFAVHLASPKLFEDLQRCLTTLRCRVFQAAPYSGS